MTDRKDATMLSLDLPGIAQHVVQRGHGRQPCFMRDADRSRYLHDLREIARPEFCAVHAYVLMDERIQLLLTPMAPGHAARMLEALGQRHADRIHLRCATRPLLDDDILRCQRRIELDPVRAGLVSQPRHYRGSSYAGNASPVPDPLLQPHRAWLALGHDAAARQRAWVELVASPVALPA